MDCSLARQVSVIKCVAAIVVTLILVLFPVVSSACIHTGWESRVSESQSPMLTLTQADNGKSIVMQVNDFLVVSLDENATNGFQWTVDSDGSPLVELQASEYIRATELGVGRGGQRVLTFKAEHTGTTELQLKLWREWEGESSIVKRFTITLQILE